MKAKNLYRTINVLNFRGEECMRFVLTLFISLLSGCTTISDLPKPQQDMYFVLKEDYLKVHTRGLLNYKWVEGLRAGTYRLVGEDKYGLFFKGEGDTVILLSQERAEKYLNTGEITPFSERNAPQLTMSGGEGGIWLPKEGIDKTPKLFYVLHNTSDGSVAGITGMAIVEMTEGAFTYWPYDDGKELIKTIRIIYGKP
jgi:hypothetical protein